MSQRFRRSAALAAVTLLASAPASANELASLFESACASVGIDPDRCFCVRDEVIAKHGEGAARYLALDMNMRYDEAAAALEQVGEDKAFAASDTFESAQHKECSSGRLARRQGEWSSGQPGGAAVSASAIAAEQPQNSGVASSRDAFVGATGIPVIDLTDHAAGAIIDVSAEFAATVLAARPANIRNFIGFYPVVDATGGIDTDGDGDADLAPGDENYVAAAQAQALPGKLYWQVGGSARQVLGEVRLPGGQRYVPFVRFKGNKPPAMATTDAASMREQVLRGMATNANLYLPFAAANGTAVPHVVKLGANAFGFAETPSADANYRDIVVTIDQLTLE